MFWVAVVLVSAFFFSIKDILSKYLLNDTGTVEFSFLFSLVATLMYTPLFLYSIGNSQIVLTNLLIFSLAVVGLSQIAGFLIRARGLKIGDISIVSPLSRMTPIFVAVSELIVFNDGLSTQTYIGIPLVALGSYIIVLDKEVPISKPIKTLSKNRAAQLAILSTVIYGLTAPASRYAVRSLNAEIFTYFIYIAMTLGFGIHLLKREKKSKLKEIASRNKASWASIGLVAFISSYLLFYSYTLVPISKANPVLQVRVIPPVIAGGLIFREENILRKTFGTLILLAGILLVII